MTKTWGLVGYGTIGSEIARQVGQKRVAERLGLIEKPAFIARSQGVMQADGTTPTDYKSVTDVAELPDVLFVALPGSQSDAAYAITKQALQQGKMVITAEKGSVATHFSELRELSDDFLRLGINATVGGGTRLLAIAKEYCQDPQNISQLHVSLNGTLTALLSSIAPPGGSGNSLGYAAYEAMKLGYAEPGAETPFDVIREEAEGDIPKKTAIFFNSLSLSDQPLDWQQLKFSLSEQDMSRVVEEARIRRFIVSFYPEAHPLSAARPEGDIIGGFSVSHSGWQIVGGFRHMERNPLFSHLSGLTGPGNGIVIGLGPDETDGAYTLSGPGAGPRPTANTMLDDYLRLQRA